MPRPKPPTFDKRKVVAENRRARFDYAVEEKFEAGIALQGTEVKSLRSGEAAIAESYAEVRDGQAWLINANIPEYTHGNRLNHEPKRPRKLLLHQREIQKLLGSDIVMCFDECPALPADRARIEEGRAALERATALAKPGPLQVLAAIHLTHALRCETGRTDWEAILRLYDALLLFRSNRVVAINRAVGVAVVGRGGLRGCLRNGEVPRALVARRRRPGRKARNVGGRSGSGRCPLFP